MRTTDRPTATPQARALAEGLAGRVGRLNRTLQREVGLSEVSFAQARTLALLQESGSLRVTDLAELERCAQPSMTLLVSRLESHGWVTRTQDAVDRRVVNVAITPEGEELLARFRRQRGAVLAERVAGLAPDERVALAAVLPVLDKLLEPTSKGRAETA